MCKNRNDHKDAQVKRDQELEDEAFVEALMEEERKRLLEVHARDLKDHLPKGTLKNREDTDKIN